MNITDPRIALAAELAAVGLHERANAMLAEVVHEQTGLKPTNVLQQQLDDTLAKLRATLGMRPRRRRAKNPKPTAQNHMTKLLEAAGLTGITAWKISRGYWLRNQVDVMRWECQASDWNGDDRAGRGWHVGSWSSMSDGARYGITVADDMKHGGGYCDVSVEPRYPKK